MAPVEQTSIPFSAAAVKSLNELKTVNKARELPVVSDTLGELEKITSNVASQLSENARVQTAKQYVEEGWKSISGTETYNNLQERVIGMNDNPRVKHTLTSVKDKVTGAVEQLDSLAAGGLASLTTAVPALTAPTPELFETTKDTAKSYFSLASEYLASFGVAQVSLKLVDKSLSVAEKTTKFFNPDTKNDSLMAHTYSKLRQTRRALRAVKRAGERKSILEKDPVARVGVVGSLASALSLNSMLGLVGLKLVADKKTPVPEIEAEHDDDERHRHIGDLKSDLAGYKSDEDPDYLPEDDSLVSSGEESDDEAEAEESQEGKDEVDEEETENL